MNSELFDYLRLTLLFGKYTCLVPIVGLGSPGEIPRFTWKSLCVFIYILYFAAISFVIGMLLYSFLASGFEVKIINPIMYHTSHFLISVMIFRFCQRLSNIIANVRVLEELLPTTRKPRATLRQINWLVAFTVTFGLMERVFLHLISIYMTHLCFKLPDESGWYMKSYFVQSFEWYFSYFPFSYTLAVIFQIVRIQAGFMWFYRDLMIMMTSLYLKNNFEIFNHLIIDENSMFTKNLKPSWSELQVHYTRLSKLVNIMNENLSAIVFISFSSDLYCVCLDIYFLLNNITENYYSNFTTDCVLKHRSSGLAIILRTVTLASQILRSSMVSYYATEVHVVSRKSLVAMHSIPPSMCCKDMKRLMVQIYYSKLGVSGLNFFLITRGMILAMMAKILTYELVVIQF